MRLLIILLLATLSFQLSGQTGDFPVYSTTLEAPVCDQSGEVLLFAGGNNTPEIVWEIEDQHGNITTHTTDNNALVVEMEAGWYWVTATDAVGNIGRDDFYLAGLNQPVLNHVAMSGCDFVVFQGDTIWNSQSLVQSYVAESGCDSIVTYDFAITGQGGYSTQWFSDCEFVALPNGGVATNDTVVVNFVNNPSGCIDTVEWVVKIYQPTSISDTVKACLPIMVNGAMVSEDTVMVNVVPGDPCPVTQELFVLFDQQLVMDTSVTETCLVSDTLSFPIHNFDPVSGCLVGITEHVIIPAPELAPTRDTVVTCDYSIPAGEEWTTVTGLDGCDSTHVTLVVHAPKQPLITISDTTCNPALAGVSLVSVYGCEPDTLKEVVYVPLSLEHEFVVEQVCSPADTGAVVTYLQSTAGCDSAIVITHYVYEAPVYDFQVETSCNPLDTGVAVIIFQNMAGCDSLVLTTETILVPVDTSYQLIPTCDLDLVGLISTTAMGPCEVMITQYYWEPAFVDAFYVDTCVASIDGMMTVDTVQGTDNCWGLQTTTFVYEPYRIDSTIWSCDGLTGDTIEPVTDSFGCVTVITYHRYNYPTSESFCSIQECESFFPFLWRGQEIAGPGNYTEVLEGASYYGCDSTIHLTVYMVQPAYGQATVQVCTGELYQFEGNLYGVGEHEIPSLSSVGCDSVLMLTVEEIPSLIDLQTPGNLTINLPEEMTEEEIDSLITGLAAGDSIVVNGAMISEKLAQVTDSTWVQTWRVVTHCDSMTAARMILIRQPSSPPVVNPPSDCEVLVKSVPGISGVYIEINNTKREGLLTYVVFNESGQQVVSGDFGEIQPGFTFAGILEFPALEAGKYFIKFEVEGWYTPAVCFVISK